MPLQDGFVTWGTWTEMDGGLVWKYSVPIADARMYDNATFNYGNFGIPGFVRY